MSFDFPILVDDDGHVAAAYGCQQEDGEIQRTVFLIDKAGLIRWAQEGRPETETILAAIDEL